MQDFTSAGDQTDRSLDRLALEITALEDALSQPSASATNANDLSVVRESSIPIADDLIKELTAAIKQLYIERLNQPPEQVRCNLLSDRLVVWIEGSITPVDKLIFSEGTSEAQRMCFRVNQLMYRQLIAMIERYLNVNVVTVVSDTCYESGCTGLIAKLSLSSKVGR